MGLLRAPILFYNRPQVFGVEGLETMSPPVLFAANHASHLDTPVIMQSLPARYRRRTSVVAAMDYFFKRRTTGFAVALTFATLPIERKRLSAERQLQIDRLVAEGWNLLMYPEGTRSLTGTLGPLKQGASRLAQRYGIPIVPIYLTGTFESHPKGSNWPTRHPVTVRFGEPLRPLEADHRVLTDQLQAAFAKLAADAGRPAP